jgi:hypothetical protein
VAPKVLEALPQLASSDTLAHKLSLAEPGCGVQMEALKRSDRGDDTIKLTTMDKKF